MQVVKVNVIECENTYSLAFFFFGAINSLDLMLVPKCRVDFIVALMSLL